MSADLLVVSTILEEQNPKHWPFLVQCKQPCRKAMPDMKLPPPSGNEGRLELLPVSKVYDSQLMSFSRGIRDSQIEGFFPQVCILIGLICI